jgi:2-polyprenyl-3-methyl-5-hydroxy-6-metoxy-1,4-benzoquinol methylase
MINYNINKSTSDQIRKHLEKCSTHFYPALSTYTNINDYSVKLKHKATRFEAWSEDEDLVGLIAMYINSSEGIGFITNVSVDIEYKGHGVASKLMDQVKEYALKNSIETIKLEVYQENIKAINFYHKHGFTKYESTLKTLLMFHKIERNYNQEFKDTADHKYAYNFDFDVMHHYMIKSFKPFFKGDDVLELGSFKGNFTERLLPYFKHITCVEASEEAVDYASNNKKLGDNVKIYNSLFENVTLPKKYNNIILTHVLEHIDNPVALLNRIKEEWLTDDGCLFVVCPNANAPSRQIAVKMGLITHNSAITPAEVEHGHRITYTLDTLERDAKQSGLKVVHRSGIFFKSLANFQWDQLLNTDIISKEYLDGCYELGQQYPDLCSSIMLICKK